jgi:hypothetical protein
MRLGKVPRLIPSNNQKKRKMSWKLSPKIDKRNFTLRPNKTEASNNGKIQDLRSKTTIIATTSNNGGQTIQATTPTGTTRRAVSAGDWVTVKRNARNG